MSSFVNGALDSSPIALPPKKQPTLDEVASRPHLKRSASTASLTLPTPKTEHRKTKQRVKSPSPEQSEGEDEEKRTTFFVGKLDFTAMDGEESSDDELFYDSSDENSPVDLSRQIIQGSTTLAPITPPASRRQAARRRKKEEDDFENPFLETPAGKVRPKLETAADEFPTVVDANGEPQFNHYVYKGKRVTFVNPLFNQPLKRRERLPVTHPDYTPPRQIKPRNLFPKEIYGRASREKSSTAPADDDNPFSAPPKSTKVRHAR